jgi:hypothetical protein
MNKYLVKSSEKAKHPIGLTVNSESRPNVNVDPRNECDSFTED